MIEGVERALAAVKKYDKLELLALLKTYGAALAYKKGEQGQSPFDLCVELGRDDLSELIISFDASSNKVRKKEAAGKISAYLLEEGPSHPFFKALTKKISKDSGVILADVEFVVAAVRFLVSRGVDVSAYSYESALQKAVRLNSKLSRSAIEEHAKAQVKAPEIAKKVIKNVLCPAQIYGISFGFDVRHFIDFTLTESGSKSRAVFRVKDFDFCAAGKDGTAAAVNLIARELEKWDRQLASAGVKRSRGPGKSRTVHELKAGFRLVRLLDEQALNFEGRMLGHCVGDGGYARYLQDPEENEENGAKFGIYSVRTHLGRPRATLEIAGGRIHQLKGPNNGHVPPDGIEAAVEAIDLLGLCVSPSDLLNIGYRRPEAWELKVFEFKSFQQNGQMFMFFPSIKIKKDIKKDDVIEHGSKILSCYIAQSSGVDVDTFSKLVSMGAEAYEGLITEAAEAGRWTILLELLAMFEQFNQLAPGRGPGARGSSGAAAINEPTQIGALHLAEKADRMDVVQKLLGAGCSINFCPEAWPYPVLHQAVKDGRLENAAELMRLGADINASGGSIALWAAKFGSKDRIDFIKKAGADLAVTDRLGRSVLEILNEKAAASES